MALPAAETPSAPRSLRAAGPVARGLVDRLDRAWAQLRELADRPATQALTAPDELTGEQWQYGQAWAHVAEFPGYWTGELCRVLDAPPTGVVPFGRVLSDEARLAAVAPDNQRTPAQVLPRLEGDLRTLRTLLLLLPGELWERRGEHAVHGVLTTAELVDEFLVGHLEEHVEQIALLHADGQRQDREG